LILLFGSIPNPRLIERAWYFPCCATADFTEEGRSMPTDRDRTDDRDELGRGTDEDIAGRADEGQEDQEFEDVEELDEDEDEMEGR
jgi:hypothetical protein